MARLDDEEGLVESSQTDRPGASSRKQTAVIQSVVAVFMLGFGVVLVIFKYPSYIFYTGNYWDSRYTRTAQLFDNAGGGIWASSVFFITACVGYNSGRNRSVISLYLALCLFSVFASMAVFAMTVISIQGTVQTKQHTSDICGQSLRYSNLRRCCEEAVDCGPSRYQRSYYYEFTEFDCDQYFDCKDEIRRVAKIHMPFYAFLVLCAVVEFICGILGASSTCTGLCKCDDCCQPGESEQPSPKQIFYGMTADGQVNNISNIPHNIPYPPPTFAPRLAPVAQTTHQQVNVA